MGVGMGGLHIDNTHIECKTIQLDTASSSAVHLFLLCLNICGYVCGFAWSDMEHGCMVYTDLVPR